MTTPVTIVAYLTLFFLVGALFLFVNLLVGKFLRPKEDNQEKLEIYECGEPTIGSSFVQFDLRFYVVALLFIIFDVEIAFFFPWATVFGKANHLKDPAIENVAVVEGELDPAVQSLYGELGVVDPTIANTVGNDIPADQVASAVRQDATQLAWLSFFDILVFFAVLMVGFAYVWKRGDLNWVRAVNKDRLVEKKKPPHIRVEIEGEQQVLVS